MAGTGKWITGGVVVFLGLLGLFAASRAADGAFYYGGFALFIGSVVYVFLVVSRHYDRVEARQTHGNDHPVGH